MHWPAFQMITPRLSLLETLGKVLLSYSMSQLQLFLSGWSSK